jgi:hypothetical protein
MKNKTNLSALFLLVVCLFANSGADTGFGISDIGALSSITGIETDKNIPTKYFLDQNYPNPFNPKTEISFGLEKASLVRLEIFNSLGQKVAILLGQRMDAGKHSVTFDAGSLSSGVYYYRITAGEFSAVKKMLLMR